MLTVQIAERIRPTVDRYQAAFPALLEIPSKEHPYGEWLSAVERQPYLTSTSFRPPQGLCPQACPEAARRLAVVPNT